MARSPVTKIASVAASSAALILSLPSPGEAHPLCLYGPDRAVSTTAEATFCPDVLAEGFCCEPNEEAVLSEKYAAIEGTLSAECAPLYKEVLCGVCSPYSAHLYTRLAEMGDDGLAMTRDFCDGFVMACGADLALDATYCDEHVLDYSDENAAREYWSYPLDITAGFNEASVTAAFPDLPEEVLPPEPIAMQMTPDGSAWWIGGMTGYIKMAASQDPTDAIDVLDISDRADFSYEQGLLGFAFSPSFTETGLFYVSYTVAGVMNPENGLNRLSKFVYYAGDVVATSGSEEILLTSTEKGSSVHSSGWVGFAPSSYADPEGAYHVIYWTVGDGGPQNDPDNKAQDMTNLHGSIVRISVPSTAMGTGYEIPVGNPFDGANGEKPEICAWGLRNPHRCAFDTATDELYCGDVGQDRVEEVNVIECGKDFGWRMFEGSRCNDGFEGYDGGECSGLDRADYAFPIFEYCHFDYDSSQEEFDACGDRTVTGLSVIGGHVYRGAKYDDILGGHYIFADHSVGSLHHLAPAAGGGWTAGTILSSIPKIGSFAEGNDGELYMVGYQGNIYDLPCGDLCESVEEQEEASSACLPQSDTTPTFEEIGCFLDGQPKTMTLSTAPGCDGTMNAEMCASFCATVEGATHFGLQYQRECYCGGEGDDYAQYGDQLDDAECDMPCSGFPTQMCGGRSKMNVFAITSDGAPSEDVAATLVSTASPSTDTETTPPPTDVPAADATSTAAPPPTTTTSGASSFPETYMGCYGDDKGDRALTFAYTASDTMSFEECESFCSTAGASIFALEYGRQCFCGTDEKRTARRNATLLVLAAPTQCAVDTTPCLSTTSSPKPPQTQRLPQPPPRQFTRTTSPRYHPQRPQRGKFTRTTYRHRCPQSRYSRSYGHHRRTTTPPAANRATMPRLGVTWDATLTCGTTDCCGAT
ncbi:unnamed protein product [Ectocarpus sp. 6 AP-2014]